MARRPAGRRRAGGGGADAAAAGAEKTPRPARSCSRGGDSQGRKRPRARRSPGLIVKRSAYAQTLGSRSRVRERVLRFPLHCLGSLYIEQSRKRTGSVALAPPSKLACRSSAQTFAATVCFAEDDPAVSPESHSRRYSDVGRHCL
jgi:hypothetical protein